MPLKDTAPIDTVITHHPVGLAAYERPSLEQELIEQWRRLHELAEMYSDSAHQRSGIFYNGLIDSRLGKAETLEVIEFVEGQVGVAGIRHFRSTYTDDVPRSESGRLFLPDGTVYETTEERVQTDQGLVSRFSVNTVSEKDVFGRQYLLLPGIVEEVGDKLPLNTATYGLVLASEIVNIYKLRVLRNAEPPKEDSTLLAVVGMAQLLRTSLQTPHLV